MDNNQKEKEIMKVSWLSIAGNTVLSIFKLGAGLFGKSTAMVSDAVHSMSDVFSTVVVMVGVKIAGKESDHSHPYGHERFEPVAAILLAMILFGTGTGIGYSALMTIIKGEYRQIAVPGILPLLAAVISIITKEGMYQYTKYAAKRTESGALMADAWHHRSDSFSSIGSFIGIFGARLGYPAMDALAGIIICIFIIKASYDIFMDSINKMTDRACDDDLYQEIKQLIEAEAGVIQIDQLKTRIFGDRIYVDVEVQADGNSTLSESHQIAENVHNNIEERFPKVKHCMVHVNPYIEEVQY